MCVRERESLCVCVCACSTHVYLIVCVCSAWIFVTICECVPVCLSVSKRAGLHIYKSQHANIPHQAMNALPLLSKTPPPFTFQSGQARDVRVL